MSSSPIKRKKPAIFGLVWLILMALVSLYLAGQPCIGDPDCGPGSVIRFLLNLNVLLLPSWILFLFSLDLKKKNRWKYGRKSSH
jgi:hypothetical protein